MNPLKTDSATASDGRPENAPDSPCDCTPPVTPFPMDTAHNTSSCCSDTNQCSTGEADEPCCGAPPGPASGPDERPGYAIMPFVEEFIQTAVGKIPRVKTRNGWHDRLGTLGARIGATRSEYKIAPGIYAVGHPTADSPVMVSANYKLSFDVLRCALKGIDAWLLVIDTRGINVWCAAGKALFGTEEVNRRVRETGLASLVNHRTLILPQLSATGVSAKEVRNGTGFKVVWGPVKAEDIPEFLASNQRADEKMRRVTFRLPERLVLIPVELSFVAKTAGWTALIVFLLSGIGPGIFSIGGAWERGLVMAAAWLLGVVAGAVAVPALLPWLPGRAFALKGVVTGIAGGLLLLLLTGFRTGFLESIAIVLCTTVVSSYLAMNFTGSTPFTSPTGVEREMRKAIPIQLAAVVITVITWVGGAFG